MNLLLENTKQMKWQTDMRKVFAAMPNVCESHDWLLSDLECNWYPDDRISEGQDPLLISGTDLEDIIGQHEIQFIWAVFSALPKDVAPKLSQIPHADGNSNFWKGSPLPQLSEAEFEIVCWDSTSTLLIGLPDDLATQFKTIFTDTIELDETNKTGSSNN